MNIVYLLPPLAGALIGFVTNVIAIRMLFRPLREIRIFGIRLPFTPGILPRQRHKLADSIGAMVERELLTPELLRQRLAQEDLRQKLHESLSLFTKNILERPLDDFFKEEIDTELGGLIRSLGLSFFKSPAIQSAAELIKKQIYDEAEKQYAAAGASLVRFLRQKDMRREMEIHGRVFLSGVILKLNVFQRFFLSAAQYDRTLDEQMPQIVDNLIDQIEQTLAEENIRLKVLAFCGSVLNQHLAAERTLSDFLARLKESLIKDHGRRPLLELLCIGNTEKEQLDNSLCNRLLHLADEEIESLLRTINVKTMVSQRIDALEMIRVERIILDVMANQLKWINVFGAILGFLIGLFQVLINRLIH